MPFVNVHPAPGLGEMLPGWFVVPNNPFYPNQPVGIGTGVGMVLPAMERSKRNVLMEAAQSVGRGPSEHGGKEPVVIHGVGAIDPGELNPATWDTSTWLIVGVGAFLVLSLLRKDRREYKAAKLRAKAEYLEKLSSLKKKHPYLSVSAYEKMRELAARQGG